MQAPQSHLSNENISLRNEQHGIIDIPHPMTHDAVVGYSLMSDFTKHQDKICYDHRKKRLIRRRPTPTVGYWLRDIVYIPWVRVWHLEENHWNVTASIGPASGCYIRCLLTNTNKCLRSRLLRLFSSHLG